MKPKSNRILYDNFITTKIERIKDKDEDNKTEAIEIKEKMSFKVTLY